MSKTPALSGPRPFVNPRVDAQEPQRQEPPSWEGKKLPWGIATNPILGPATKPSPAQQRVNDAVVALNKKLEDANARTDKKARPELRIKNVTAGVDAQGKPTLYVNMKTHKLSEADKQIAKRFVEGAGFGKLPMVVSPGVMPMPSVNPAPGGFHTIGGKPATGFEDGLLKQLSPAEATSIKSEKEILDLQKELHDAGRQFMKDLREGTEPKAEQLKERFGVDFPTHPALKGKTDFA